MLQETGEQVALKRCRLQNEMTPKLKHRWQLEVDIMKRLNHDNVILALEVPEELSEGPEEFPLLAMEYCSKGDLRRVSGYKFLKGGIKISDRIEEILF